MKNINSRQLARTWPYTRYKSFEASLRKSAEQWFSERGCETIIGWGTVSPVTICGP